jgi:DNA polymerase I-like protein with 3'-5' exonuclease and polymerase domains
VVFPARVHTDTRSTDEAALSRLAAAEDTPADVQTLLKPMMARRLAAKILSTYCEPFERKAAWSVTGRLHGQFNMAVTNTGRKSSSGPNLQNIPELVRAAIAVIEGRAILAADAKQLEVVAAAYQSRDPALRKALLDGKDIHGLIKRRVDKRTGRDVKRTDIKRIVFGRIYGGGAATLSAQSGVPIEVVREIIAALDRMFPVQAKHFHTIEAALNEARQPIKGEGAMQEYEAYYVLPTGRRLRFTTEGGEWPYSGMKNRPIQALATGDFVPFAEMLYVALLWENIELILSGDILPIGVAHDEIDTDVSDKARPIVRQWWHRIQRQLVPALNKFYSLDPAFDLPLVIECGAGRTWAEAKKDENAVP